MDQFQKERMIFQAYIVRGICYFCAEWYINTSLYIFIQLYVNADLCVQSINSWRYAAFWEYVYWVPLRWYIGTIASNSKAENLQINHDMHMMSLGVS